MNYCLPPDKTVEINLNIPNGADAQCAHDRSGLLCGACSPGLSLSLGSSHCLPCQIHWPGILVAIIISSIYIGRNNSRSFAFTAELNCCNWDT